MTFKPNPGDEVYSTDGRMAVYVGRVAGDHYVTPIYEREHSEPYFGDPERWRDVHQTPPTEKKIARIAELDATIAERTAELRRVNKELDDAGRRRAEQLKKLSQQQALDRIEDYLDGKFTHFLVVPGYGAPYIELAEKAIEKGGTSSENEYGRAPTKLLTLFGDSRGNLQWRINRYSDGSGSSHQDVHPCQSEQEAIEIVRKLYAKALEEWRERPLAARHYGPIIDWSTKIPQWVTIPEDVADYLADLSRQQQENARKRALDEIAKAEKILADLKASAA